jgi:beta-glucuronidase
VPKRYSEGREQSYACDLGPAAEHPQLYRVHIHAGQDDLEDEMGFRTVEVRGTQILLNGSPIFLRGVSIHAEAPYRAGRANNDEGMNT